MLSLSRSASVRRTLQQLAAATSQAPPSVFVGRAASSRFLSSSSSSSTSSEDAKSLAESQAQPATEKGFLGKLWDRMSIKGQQKRILTAEMLFQAATQQANDPNWYGPGRIPRDFRSRHAMLTMHLWFLHKRLIASNVSNGTTLDTDTCLRIQEELFEIFWNDTLCRLRAQPNVREMSVNKYLLQVQQYTFLHLFHYDHIFGSLASSQSHLDEQKTSTSKGDHEEEEENNEKKQDLIRMVPPREGSDGADDDEEGEMDPLSVLDPNVDLTQRSNRIAELKKLIWMHILVRNPDGKESDDHLERLAWYIEEQYQNILVDWPGKYVEEARVGWINLPDFTDLKSNKGQLMEKRFVNPEDVIPEPWLTNITLRGDYYYWNPTNGKSQWEKPKKAEG